MAGARGISPYRSIPELSHRAGIGPGALVRLANADAFRSLSLSRRDAAWAIKALRKNALPLFEAAQQRTHDIVPEQIETPVLLPVMTQGREVVEDYRSQGLSLRPHPLTFLRQELASRQISSCAALRTATNG